MTPSDVKATLSFSDNSPSVEMPIYKGTLGPDVIDIRKLYGQTGKFTYDPGFMSTAACNSEITYIDGDKGRAAVPRLSRSTIWRRNADFLETCYLLLKGRIAERSSRRKSSSRPSRSTRWCTSQMHFFFRGFRRDAHPMAILVAAVGALSAFYHDSLDIANPLHRDISAIRMIAKLPTLVAMAYKYTVGQPFVYPKNDLSYSANFMRMMFSNPCGRVQGQRRAGARAGPHPDPPCGPRTECIDLDRASRRLVGRESRSRVSRPVSHVCGARRMAARMKPR
ncbi:citrate/2-methylcitrate synthase [Paraburkholderia dipogonis]|uniref:citrate/2-methylcitrate synthase n=1 Tax=Paraburkholderia dipogonis TaxID=1211383 RepID=UPI00406BA72F